jgi:hypothetical protein
MLSMRVYVQRRAGGRAAWGLAMMLLLLVAGCTPHASYMQKWQPVERIANRWSGGTIRADRLSEDEKAAFEALGTPDVIRFFRQVPTSERVYAWIYEASNQVIWFVDGQQVDYVEVDSNPLPLSWAERQTLQQKIFAGGILAGTIGALATGFILFSEDVGLKD